MASETERRSSWWAALRGFCCRVLRTGEVPRHVAIIMDGNRRFARKMHLDRSMQGHMMGFEKFRETLEWCLDLGISELTVYAFSIENFKRCKEEVDGLMELSKQKIAKLLEERDLIMRHGVCIRVLGDIQLLSSDVREAVARAVLTTQNNSRVFLNVCFAYTSRHEMAASVRTMAEGTVEGAILPSDVSEELLEKCMYSGDSPPPDLVLRTSGEVRLSDFLLWQSSYSCLCFQEVLWPEFSIWDFFAAILHYQRDYRAIQEARKEYEAERQRRQAAADTLCVLEKWPNLPPAQVEGKIKDYAEHRQRRVEGFLERVQDRNRLLLERVCPSFCTL